MDTLLIDCTIEPTHVRVKLKEKVSCVNICMYAPIHMYMHKYINMYIHAYIRTYVLINTLHTNKY